LSNAKLTSHRFDNPEPGSGNFLKGEKLDLKLKGSLIGF